MSRRIHKGTELIRPRLSHPRMGTPRNETLGVRLDSIHELCDDAIHRGYCCRDGRKLDEALEGIIAAAEAARELLRTRPAEDLKLRLEFEVAYDLDGADPEEMRQNLRTIAHHAVDECMVTGDSAATMAAWDYRVVDVTRRVT